MGMGDTSGGKRNLSRMENISRLVGSCLFTLMPCNGKRGFVARQGGFDALGMSCLCFGFGSAGLARLGCAVLR